MIDISTSLPTVGAAFVASAVEVVEAFTIVLAVGLVRGLKPAVTGAICAILVLVVAVALLGPLLQRVPVRGFQIVLGALLLVFGLGWLRKAVLRAGGALPLHDETAAFEKEAANLRAQSAAAARAGDWLAGLVAFKAVLLEGTEVVFIVLAVGAKPGLLLPAAIGAGVACVLVLTIGVLLRAPLSSIPENSLKFTVGGLLTGFGVFWCCEGRGAPWIGGDAAILPLVVFYLLAGLVMAAATKRAWKPRA